MCKWCYDNWLHASVQPSLLPPNTIFATVRLALWGSSSDAVIVSAIAHEHEWNVIHNRIHPHSALDAIHSSARDELDRIVTIALSELSPF